VHSTIRKSLVYIIRLSQTTGIVSAIDRPIPFSSQSVFFFCHRAHRLELLGVFRGETPHQHPHSGCPSLFVLAFGWGHPVPNKAPAGEGIAAKLRNAGARHITQCDIKNIRPAAQGTRNADFGRVNPLGPVVDYMSDWPPNGIVLPSPAICHSFGDSPGHFHSLVFLLGGPCVQRSEV
jgi:hypothetical protein